MLTTTFLMVDKKRDKVIDKVVSILKANSSGLTITELVKLTKLNRSAVRTALAILDGAEKVSVKRIGMAKVYSLKRSER
jgi:predicted transcriptional regulator